MFKVAAVGMKLSSSSSNKVDVAKYIHHHSEKGVFDSLFSCILNQKRHQEMRIFMILNRSLRPNRVNFLFEREKTHEKCPET